MEREYEQTGLIDLGAASDQTLGREGRFPDLVGEIPAAGISEE